jgi:hypothetical protein
MAANNFVGGHLGFPICTKNWYVLQRTNHINFVGGHLRFLIDNRLGRLKHRASKSRGPLVNVYNIFDIVIDLSY